MAALATCAPLPAPSPAPAPRLARLSLVEGRSPGRPLPTSTRAAMEERFGHDFSRVRIHADDAAARSADALAAQAFTVGPDIAFARGRFDPTTRPGLRLLAHELAHVVQQGAGPGSGPVEVDGDTPDAAEHEARAAADAAVAPTPIRARVTNRRIRRLQRSPGSAAGGCGICMGWLAAGIEAHARIEHAMRRKYMFVRAELGLPASPGDDNGRLDLAALAGPALAIGEIKPANLAGQIQGDLDLRWYEEQLWERDPPIPTTRLRYKPPNEPIPFDDPEAIGCPYAQKLYVNPPVHGIYTYYCEPDFRVLRPRCRCRTPLRNPQTVPAPVLVPTPAPVGVPRTAPELVPVGGPVHIPQGIPAPPEPVADKIRRFLREVVELGLDTAAAARDFLEENADVLAFLAAIALVVGAVAIVLGTLAEDVATGGVGIADDPASFAAASALLAAAGGTL